MERSTADFEMDRDLAAIQRIWREVGWIDGDDDGNNALETFLGSGHSTVGLLNGEAECLTHWCDGSIRYENSDLGLSVISAVTTSLIGRKQGFASHLTAEALASAAAAGHSVSALGMFEQGFYDRLGFGSGTYTQRLEFDPATLNVGIPYRAPVRVTSGDWADVYAAMVSRYRGHGAVMINDPRFVAAELAGTKNFLGLGYRDESGRLTHFVLGSASGEHGPFDVFAIAYQNPEQLLELLRLLRELADQLHTVRMDEPAEIQLQDLLVAPIRSRHKTMKDGRYPITHNALAYWQLRILDVAACISARHWQGNEVAFDLTITDPVSDFLTGDWKGVGGDYSVVVGAESRVNTGHVGGLGVLEASIGAFTRMWFGVRGATSLALTDDLTGPASLLDALDEALLLPLPTPGWQF